MPSRAGQTVYRLSGSFRQSQWIDSTYLVHTGWRENAGFGRLSILDTQRHVDETVATLAMDYGEIKKPNSLRWTQRQVVTSLSANSPPRVSPGSQVEPELTAKRQLEFNPNIAPYQQKWALELETNVN